jgi:hypothetical protein
VVDLFALLKQPDPAWDEEDRFAIDMVERTPAGLRTTRDRLRFRTLLRELHLLYRAPIGFPRTNYETLLLPLSCEPTEWRALLATEMLLHLKCMYEVRRHKQAVDDAKKWCTNYNLTPPDWLRDAPPPKRKRTRSFLTDYTRFLAVEAAQREIARECSPQGSRDQFKRAAKMVKESSVGAVIRSFYKFRDERDKYYISPDAVLAVIRELAPTVSEILHG